MLSGLDLAGKTIMVTGGMGALGCAVVETLLANGANCVVPGIIPSELERFPFRGDGRVQVRFPVQLNDEAAVRDLYAAVPKLWGSVHIAGGFAMSALADTSADALSAQLEMNLKTCFLCCREASQRIRANGMAGGRLVNIAARPSLRPEQGGGMVAYAVSKSGVATLTQALAAELAADNVLVNAIAPSTLDTPANRAAMPNAKHHQWVPLAAAADLIAYLVSPANQAVSGAVIPIYARA